jgi:DNA (cytosine-5)-methyltransferase 1
MQNNVRNFLEEIYIESKKSLYDLSTDLDENQVQWVDFIVKYEQQFRGVFTVLISSLTYKFLYPEQDTRFHKKIWDNGYSGRTFDTKNVTPFLQDKKFRGNMRESGWLTRSLEQPYPFDLNFPGKIRNIEVKNAFLNDIEENNINPLLYLQLIFKKNVTVQNSMVSMKK